MAKVFDARIEGLNGLLRDFRQLGKEAQKELRAASKNIANDVMVPAWREAALNGAGAWGQTIADSVKAGSDRVPKVMIGSKRKTLSGSASPTMVRYPSDKGNRSRSGKGINNRIPAAFGSGTDWIGDARSYAPKAIDMWGKAVDRIIYKWKVM